MPRRYVSGVEVFFVIQGKIDYGFAINKKVKK